MPSADNTTAIFQRPAELLQNLIRSYTTNPPGNESEYISFIKDLLSKAGAETKILAKQAQRPNLIARLAGRGGAAPFLLI